MTTIPANAAAEVADRFKHFRTPHNVHFFNALVNHLSALKTDPCLPMYFEFAITCNDRGRQIANLLEKYTDLEGKRYLDLGCAYGGFLVAFAEKGADVTGMDIDAGLLNLGQSNLLDHGLDVPLLLRDITTAADLQGFESCFDVITCNDVIEHVSDPQALVSNIAHLMHDGSLAYFEIPNRYHPCHVLKDGHHQLFGITLLEYPEAKEYYSLQAPGVPYTVGHYLEIDQYATMFRENGLRLSLLDETFASATVDTVVNDLEKLRAYAPAGIEEVPGPLRKRVEERLASYFQEIESAPRASTAQQRDFVIRYGAGFWRVLGRKLVLPQVAPQLDPTNAKETPGLL